MMCEGRTPIWSERETKTNIQRERETLLWRKVRLFSGFLFSTKRRQLGGEFSLKNWEHYSNEKFIIRVCWTGLSIREAIVVWSGEINRLKMASVVSSANESHALGPKKTVFVMVIVVGCIAILWPKVFYPMLIGGGHQAVQPQKNFVKEHRGPGEHCFTD